MNDESMVTCTLESLATEAGHVDAEPVSKQRNRQWRFRVDARHRKAMKTCRTELSNWEREFRIKVYADRHKNRDWGLFGDLDWERRKWWDASMSPGGGFLTSEYQSGVNEEDTDGDA